jgi:spore maturation protein CgeB
MFVPSLRADWNNGNAHFLRGLARALGSLGHQVRAYEPRHGWSYENLLQEPEGPRSLQQFESDYPDLDVALYELGEGLKRQVIDDLAEADIVLVHEWSAPELVAAVLDLRDRFGFKALFHDTHHRVCSLPAEIERLQVRRFDGVLAFGDVLRQRYRDQVGIERVWTLHEAADTTVFRPIGGDNTDDCVWIGNWGDEERTRELHEFLIEPARSLPSSRFAVYGVRYPPEARNDLASAGIAFRGYLPNLSVPCVFAHAALTLHVPRRQYAEVLPGIPTIRVFEALACGIPLVCSPWDDAEHLFDDGAYRVARDGREMTSIISELLADRAAREQMSRIGLECIRQGHTCRHRAQQLTEICEEVLA